MKTGGNESNYAKTGRFLGIYFSSAAEFLPCFLAGWIFIPPPLGVAFGHNIYPCKKAFPGWPPPLTTCWIFQFLSKESLPTKICSEFPLDFFSHRVTETRVIMNMLVLNRESSLQSMSILASLQNMIRARGSFFYGIQLCTPKMRICTPNVPAQNLGPNADTRKKVFIFNIWLCMASIPFLNYTV